MKIEMKRFAFYIAAVSAVAVMFAGCNNDTINELEADRTIENPDSDKTVGDQAEVVAVPIGFSVASMASPVPEVDTRAAEGEEPGLDVRFLSDDECAEQTRLGIEVEDPSRILDCSIEDESTVDNMWLIQFDEEGNLLVAPQYITCVEGEVPTAYLCKGKSRIYFIVNSFDETLFADTTTEEQIADAKRDVYSVYDIPVQNTLPMCGLFEGAITDDEPLSVVFYRTVAKLTIKLSAPRTGASITSFSLDNISRSLYYWQDASQRTASKEALTHNDSFCAALKSTKDLQTVVCYVPVNLQGTFPVNSQSEKTTDCFNSPTKISLEYNYQYYTTASNVFATATTGATVVLGLNNTTDANIIANCSYEISVVASSNTDIFNVTDRRWQAASLSMASGWRNTYYGGHPLVYPYSQANVSSCVANGTYQTCKAKCNGIKNVNKSFMMVDPTASYANTVIKAAIEFNTSWYNDATDTSSDGYHLHVWAPTNPVDGHYVYTNFQLVNGSLVSKQSDGSAARTLCVTTLN